MIESCILQLSLLYKSIDIFEWDSMNSASIYKSNYLNKNFYTSSTYLTIQRTAHGILPDVDSCGHVGFTVINDLNIFY